MPARSQHAASPSRQMPARRAAAARSATRSESPGQDAAPARGNPRQRSRAQEPLETVPEGGPAAAQTVETAAPAQRTAKHSNKPTHSSRLRQTTPDQDQLQEDLRQASEEPQESKAQEIQRDEPQLARQLTRPQPLRPPHDLPPAAPVETLEDWQTRQLSSSQLLTSDSQGITPSSDVPPSRDSWPDERGIPKVLDNDLPRDKPQAKQQPGSSTQQRKSQQGDASQHDIPPDTPNGSSDDAEAIGNVVNNVPILRPTTNQHAVPQLEISKKDLPSIPQGTRRYWNKHNIVLVLTTTILTLLAAFAGVFMASENALGITSKIHFPFSLCGGSQSCAPYVADAFNKLSSKFDKRLDDMAKEVATVKDEVQQKAGSVPAQSANPLLPLRVNFLTPSMGAFVDPHLTSPTTLMAPMSFVARVARRMTGMHQRAMTPIAALQPWQELGECWCSPSYSPQLAVNMGYQIIPEEVIVEHIQPGATLDPTLAPRQMELWAEYSPIPPKDGASPPNSQPTSTSSDPLDTKPKPKYRGPKRAHLPSLPVPPSELEYLLSTLRMAYPGEPDENFTRNPTLGPSFFRLGKWEYDAHSEQNIQRFKLDAVIDLPGYRVSKVIVRSVSNWGGQHTCLYRVRLHGRP